MQTRISSRDFHCGDIHYADLYCTDFILRFTHFIICILLYKFHCMHSIMCISLCAFHCVQSIIAWILLRRFRCKILFCGSYCINSIILSGGFPHTNSIVRILLCRFYCPDFIVPIPLCKFR